MKKKKEKKKQSRERRINLPEVWAIFGLGVSGTVFGVRWWFWINAIVSGD